jgi:Ca-activated chloride channel family protein
MDSPAAGTVHVRADFDRSLVWEAGRSVRYLGITVSAEAAPAGTARQRPPLNLALVVDASGSMGGGRLDAARRAALDLIGRLTDRDVLSVVSFSSDVITHLEPRPLSEDNKRAALRAVEGLHTRGSTNLSAGWLRGAGCVGSYMQAHPDCNNRVLLLTDGHANEGIVDPLELGREAERLCGRGICTSAVGIGDGYSSEQIASIATNGSGQLHHASTPQHIVEVVLGELSDLAGTVAENITIEVVYSPGVKVELLGDFPVTHHDQQVRCAIGSAIAGRPRLAIFKVTAPAGSPGEQLPFHPRVQWNPVGSQALQTVGTDPVILHFAHESDNNNQPRQVGLSVEVARVWQGAVLLRAVGLNRERLYSEAQRLLQQELPHFERYCQGLPDTASLVQQMKDALRDSSGDWGEDRRKEIGTYAYKAERQQADHRNQS